MAFEVIDPTEIEAGDPVKQELWSKTKNSLDDLNTRVSDVETSSASNTPMGFIINSEGFVADNLAAFRVPFNITITGIRLDVNEAGTAGTTSIDVLSNQSGTFATVLSGNITLAFGAGDLAGANEPGLVVTDIDAGKFIRLDIDAIQTDANGYTVCISYDVRV